MIPLSPSLLIAAANAFVGLGHDGVVRPIETLLDARDRTLAGSRTTQPGVLAETFLRQVWAGPRAEHFMRWDTALVHHVGYWSHYDADSGKSSWPLAPTATPQELGKIAESRGVLESEPWPGDIFLLWCPARDEFTRTGIVVKVAKEECTEEDETRYRECITIEGDSDPTMTRAGGVTLRHRRKLSADRNDRFVRWAELDARRIRGRDVGRPTNEFEMRAAA